MRMPRTWNSGQDLKVTADAARRMAETAIREVYAEAAPKPLPEVPSIFDE